MSIVAIRSLVGIQSTPLRFFRVWFALVLVLATMLSVPATKADEFTDDQVIETFFERFDEIRKTSDTLYEAMRRLESALMRETDKRNSATARLKLIPAYVQATEILGREAEARQKLREMTPEDGILWEEVVDLIRKDYPQLEREALVLLRDSFSGEATAMVEDAARRYREIRDDLQALLDDPDAAVDIERLEADIEIPVIVSDELGFTTRMPAASLGPADARDIEAIESRIDHAESWIHFLETQRVPSWRAAAWHSLEDGKATESESIELVFAVLDNRETLLQAMLERIDAMRSSAIALARVHAMGPDSEDWQFDKEHFETEVAQTSRALDTIGQALSRSEKRLGGPVLVRIREGHAETWFRIKPIQDPTFGVIAVKNMLAINQRSIEDRLLPAADRAEGAVHAAIEHSRSLTLESPASW